MMTTWLSLEITTMAVERLTNGLIIETLVLNSLFEARCGFTNFFEITA